MTVQKIERDEPLELSEVPKRRYLVFASDARQTCGVEEFTRQLARRLGPQSRLRDLDMTRPKIVNEIRSADAIVLSFPIVAWKRRLVSPTLAAVVARTLGRDVVVVLHEWSDLDWKRRLVVAPVMLLATRVLFSAPEIAREFAHSAYAGLTTKSRAALPIPPNILPPKTAAPSELGERLRELRKPGRLIIGQFGSIYPKKQSTAVLQVAAHLIGQGHDVGIAFVGSFIKGMDDVEKQFFELATRLGVMDRLLVTGYVQDEREMAGLFAQIDVFCYLFPSGLTSRRASVLTAALSGTPVVVNAPESPDALSHHSLFQKLIETRAITLVDTDAEIPAIADAVLEASRTKPESIDIAAEVESLWGAAVSSIDADAHFIAQENK